MLSLAKNRLNFTVIILSIASIVLIGVFTFRNAKTQLEKSFEDLAKNESLLFDSIIDTEQDELSIAHTGMDLLVPILAPFARRDVDGLLAAAQPIFNEIRVNNNITHMYFIEPD